MRELYNEYFYVPKEGKVREKVLFSRIAVAVIIMLIWMSAIGFTAYAYFTCSVTSGINTITSATYGMETEIVDSDDSQTKLEPSSQDGMTSIYEVGAGVYNITLTATGTATTEGAEQGAAAAKRGLAKTRDFLAPVVPALLAVAGVSALAALVSWFAGRTMRRGRPRVRG